MAIPFMGKRPPKRVARPLSPGDVFTPRSDKVTDMYVPRPSLEEALSGIFDSSEVHYLFGHSGSGKTWLYKKLFRENDVYFYDIPFQRLSDGKSFDDLIRHHLGHLGVRSETSSTKGAAVEGRIAGVGAGVGQSTRSRGRSSEHPSTCYSPRSAISPPSAAQSWCSKMSSAASVGPTCWQR